MSVAANDKDQKHYNHHIDQKIFKQALPLVAKALRGERPQGSWTPYMRAIQQGIDVAYEVVGFWPRPVEIESPLHTSIRVLKLSQEQPFTDEQCHRYLVLVNSLFHRLDLFEDARKSGYWT